ncbi:MAG: hypothetical protein LIO96_04535 [Lachnospiraceae bacterium]|nr:hypothetical protein [Lachnospiraceae bacterium]
MTAQEAAEKIRHGKIKDENEWLEALDAIDFFMKEDHPIEEKRKFFPLGWGEVASIICDGILRGHGSDLDEYVKNGRKKL